MHTSDPAFDAFVHALYQLRDTIRKTVYNELKIRYLDITVEMLEVLGVLFTQDGRNQQEIANELHKHKASITSLIDNLVNRGLVERRAQQNDKRNNLIFLTPQAAAYRQVIQEILHDLYDKLRQRVGESEIETVTLLFRQLTQSLDS